MDSIDWKSHKRRNESFKLLGLWRTLQTYTDRKEKRSEFAEQDSNSVDISQLVIFNRI